MTYDQFNAFCGGLAATTHVVQWGGADVWKVGGKVFAIGGWDDGVPRFVFKVSEIAFEVMKDLPGLRPAPYFASRGLKWIQHFSAPGLEDADLREHFERAHRAPALGLSRRKRCELGLNF